MIDVGEDIDKFERQVINITRRVKDFTDIKAKGSEFTRTFDGPASRKNMTALQNYGIIGTLSEFNPHKGVEAKWRINDAVEYRGKLEVGTVVYKEGEPYSITFTFYGQQRGISTIFGVDRFSDVDFSEYNHVLSRENVVDSWGGSLVGGDVLYPLIDTVSDWWIGDPSTSLTGNIRNPVSPILLATLKPAIKLQKLLKTLFSNYDLELAGDLVDSSTSQIANAYVLLNRWSGSKLDPEVINDNFLNAGDATSPLVTSGEEIIELDDNYQFGQDDANQWTGSNLYTPIATGTHIITLNINAELTGPNAPNVHKLIMKVNGDVELEQTYESNNFANFLNPNIWFSEVFLQAGDLVQFYIAKETGKDIQVLDGTLNIKPPTIEIGELYTLNSQMPDIKLVDWLGALLASWNWIIYPDRFNSNKWYVESVPDWYDTGEKVDWKNKIDLENITYKKPKVYKEINLKYKESESVAHKAFRDQTNRGFGEVQIRPDVEFADKELVLENPCTLIPPSLFEVFDDQLNATGTYADLTLHKSLSQDGTPVEEKCLLFMYRGEGGTSHSYYLQDDVNLSGQPTSTEMFTFPFISATYDTIFPPTGQGTSLAFSLESDVNGNITPNTMYRRSWESQLRVQYAKESRQIERASVYLNARDMLGYELNDEIFIEGQWYRIIEVSKSTSSDKAIVTLLSSRLLTARNDYNVKSGGQITYDKTPDAFELSALNAFQIGSNYYGSFTVGLIKPSPNTYLKAVTDYSQDILNEIQNLGGRLREYKDDCDG